MCHGEAYFYLIIDIFLCIGCFPKPRYYFLQALRFTKNTITIRLILFCEVLNFVVGYKVHHTQKLYVSKNIEVTNFDERVATVN